MHSEIYLAGGCFWGTEAFMARIKGVLAVESGYANGPFDAPSYAQVCEGSGHAEVVKVSYDPSVLPLSRLLHYFFQTIDPVAVNRQGNDVGVQYRTGVYYSDSADIPVINQALAQLQQQVGKPLAVELAALSQYSKAEDYHQHYLDKNPQGYCHIPFALMDEILRDQS